MLRRRRNDSGCSTYPNVHGYHAAMHTTTIKASDDILKDLEDAAAHGMKVRVDWDGVADAAPELVERVLSHDAYESSINVSWRLARPYGGELSKSVTQSVVVLRVRDHQRSDGGLHADLFHHLDQLKHDHKLAILDWDGIDMNGLRDVDVARVVRHPAYDVSRPPKNRELARKLDRMSKTEVTLTGGLGMAIGGGGGGTYRMALTNVAAADHQHLTSWGQGRDEDIIRALGVLQKDMSHVVRMLSQQHDSLGMIAQLDSLCELLIAAVEKLGDPELDWPDGERDAYVAQVLSIASRIRGVGSGSPVRAFVASSILDQAVADRLDSWAR